MPPVMRRTLVALALGTGATLGATAIFLAPPASAASCPTGSTLTNVGGTDYCIQEFTSDTSWSVPGWVSSVDVLLVGGGASGQTYDRNTNMGGAGGGAGEVATISAHSVTPGESISIQVGSGGAGAGGGYTASAGNPGSATTWISDAGLSTNLSAVGGVAGSGSHFAQGAQAKGPDGYFVGGNRASGRTGGGGGGAGGAGANGEQTSSYNSYTRRTTYTAIGGKGGAGYNASGFFGSTRLLGCGGGGGAFAQSGSSTNALAYSLAASCNGASGRGSANYYQYSWSRVITTSASAGLPNTGSGGGGGAYNMSSSSGSGSGGSGLAAVRFTPLMKELSLSVGGAIAPSTSAYSGVSLEQQPTIQLIDNAVVDAVADVTISVSVSGSGCSLASPVTATTNTSGVAAFSGVTINAASGSSCTLSFTDDAGVYSSVDSSTVTIATGPAIGSASTITASSDSLQVATPGNTSTLTAQLIDSGGNALDATAYTAFGPYEVTLSSSGAAGAVGLVTNNNDGTFTATFTGATETGTATITGSMTLGPGASGSSGSLVSETISMTPGAPAALAMATQPAAGSGGYSGQPLDTQPVINILDAYGNTVDSDSATSVAVALVQVSGSGSPSLGGTSSATASSGVATFSGLSITGAVTDTYRFDFTASGLTGVSSNNFQIAREPQSVVWDSGSSTSKEYGDAAFAIAAHAEDQSSAATDLPITFASSDESICTVAGAELPSGGVYYATVTITGAGTCNVTASQAGDDDYAPATSSALTYTVSRAAQSSLSIDSVASVVLGDSLILIGNGGSSTSELTWGSSSGPCTVSGTGVTGSLTPTGVGDCVVTLDRAGNTNYLAATQATQTVTIGKQDQTVTFTNSVPSTPDAGTSYTAEFSSSLGSSYIPSVSVTTGDGTVCSATDNADGTALVSFLSAGTCTLTASESGDSSTNSATATQSIEVGSINQTITFPPIGDTTYGALPFTVNASTSSGLAVNFTSSTPSVCTVGASTGRVTLVDIGTCTLVASRSASGVFAAANSVAISFAVAAALPGAPHLTSVSAGDTSITVSFAAPDSTGGPSEAITGYQVRATPTSGSSTTQPCAVASPLQCTITGLTNGTDYTVDVAAINSVGVGEFSASSGVMQPATSSNAVTGAYAIPASGGTSVHVYWDQLSNAAATLGGGSFTGYQLYVRARGDSWPSSSEFTTATITDTDYDVTGLTSGTTYEFKIIALTTANPNEGTSNTVTVTAYPVTVPGAPTNLQLEEVSDTSVILTWEAPASDGGEAITQYTATATGLSPCTINPNVEVLRCAFSGLPFDSTINFLVTARNSVGTGPAATASITTPKGPPPPWDGPAITWQPLPGGVASGLNLFAVVAGGWAVEATLTPNAARTGYTIEGAGTALSVVPLDTNRRPVGLAPNGEMVGEQGGWISINGQGFRSQSLIKFFVVPLTPETLSTPRSSRSPMYLGHAETNRNGRFNDAVRIPSHVTVGSWVLQAVGRTSQTTLRSINVRIDVADTYPGGDMQIVQRAGFFSGGTAKLTHRGKAKLRRLATAIPANGEITGVHVIGASTRETNRKRNRTLARKRSEKVAAFLSQQGLGANVTVRTVTRETGLSNRTVEQAPQPLFTRTGKPLTTATVTYIVATE